MEKSLVSIIVPIYNLERYIKRCIESIIYQTYENIEIILINDGSTDNSDEICRYYAKRDKRIAYYKIDNGGVSNARNYGFSKSHGDFITYVDGDDYVSNNYIMVMLQYQKEHNYDIVISNAIDFNECGIIKKKNAVKNNIILNKEDGLIHFFKKDIFTPVCWGRLYKRTIVNNILFDINMKISEDGKYFYSALENSVNTIIIGDRLYYYFIRNNSTVHSGFNEKYYDELYFCKSLVEKTKTNPLLHHLAIKKELSFIFKCIKMKKIDKINEKKLLEQFNLTYKETNKHDSRTILYKMIVNNKFLVKIIRK